jgi:hypothetical protein
MNSENRFPSIFQMIKNFSNDLKEYVAKGAPNVTIEDYTERLATCEKCPSLNNKAMRCMECGCLLEHKAKWKTTKCPLDKWKAQNVKE